MSVESTLEKLSSSLPEWSHKGFNEAQTSQVIVLRVFQALGYDIWNPFEIVAQSHSGGGSGAYAPDFTVRLHGIEKFVVEVKALAKGFSVGDRQQPVSYANNIGLRWAVLTDGKVWHFYDNQIPLPAADKLSLIVDLQDVRAASYLQRLLSRKVWSEVDATTDLADEVQAISREIRRHLELSQIEIKLKVEMQTGLTADEQGLAKAMRLALEPNERELAEESFAELGKRLLGIDLAPTPSAAPEPELQPGLELGEQPDVLAAIVEGVDKTAPTRRGNRSSDLQAWLGEVELSATSWRDINSGIVEAMIALSRKSFVSDRGFIFPTDQSRAKSDGSLYPTSAYRRLSTGEFLFLHDSANHHLQRSRRMLEELGVPPRAMRVCYRGDTLYLP